MMNNEFLCRVCGHNAHGNHFGVYSCRACAAFFRRTANSKLEVDECRRKGRRQEKCLCKPCRLRLCLENGMNTENFQFNREANLPLKESSLTPSITSFVGRPEFLLFCDPDNISDSDSKPKTFIDVQNLISEASRILDYGYQSPCQAESQLKKLNLGFNFLKFNNKNLKSYEKIGKKEFLDLIEFYFIAVSKWIVHFDEFRNLEKAVQMTLIQSIWHIWRKLHKCVATAMYRKAQTGKVDPTQKVMRNMLINRKTGKIDTSWMSDYSREHATSYMLSQNMYDYDVIDALLKLDPTDIEFTYMFAQLSFEYAGKRFQGEIQKITDQLQQILSNDLHDYYINDQKRERYFYRLNELMKVNNLIQRSIWESRPHRELGRVFNVLKIEFSHPEMFEDSGFM